jgi:hypothetical protein
MNNSIDVPKELKIDPPHDLAIALLGIHPHPKEMKSDIVRTFVNATMYPATAQQ